MAGKSIIADFTPLVFFVRRMLKGGKKQVFDLKKE